MTNEEIFELMFQEQVELDQLIYLAALSSNGSPTFDRFLELDVEEQEAVVGKFSEHYSDVLAYLQDANKYGFLAQAYTPLLYRENGYYQVSGGVFRTKWFYAESMSDLVSQALEWAASGRFLEENIIEG